MSWRDHFNPRVGVVGALVMSVAVWIINSGHGPLLATTAALKQAAYTFFFAGFIMQLCDRLAHRGSPLAISVGLPSLLTVVLLYGIHMLRGTPEPVLSVLPAAILAPPSFAVWTIRVRRSLAAG